MDENASLETFGAESGACALLSGAGRDGTPPESSLPSSGSEAGPCSGNRADVHAAIVTMETNAVAAIRRGVLMLV